MSACIHGKLPSIHDSILSFIQLGPVCPPDLCDSVDKQTLTLKVGLPALTTMTALAYATR